MECKILLYTGAEFIHFFVSVNFKNPYLKGESNSI